ncbi:helix-turn-helix domain-containing protein [Labrenzia sp. PHM005]|uniref:helix-turn-helix domain-containing protein n=1 Tax=Labrenzia sp. PHM005 TaxID=2590016 RepID=UPI00114015CD|nr:helix-turn-helix domain-containing protein [Labrenzia sp. PHM005]QDG79056.1 AraC family transcriptional regulator [Labrenzia sp. PHM005]
MNSDCVRFETFDEIEMFWFETMGISPSLTQLTAGPLNFELRAEDFEGVTLNWVRSEGRQLWRDVLEGDGLHIGYMIESEGAVLSSGLEVGPKDALVWHPGQETDYLLHGPLLSLEISVSEDLVDVLGWTPRGAPLRRVPGERLNRLTKVCQRASRWLRLQGISDSPEFRNQKRMWRDHVLEVLSEVLMPWMEAQSVSVSAIPASRQHKIVRSAETVFELGEDDGQDDIDTLAGQLGMSKRKLYYAFQSTLGIGPRRYFELRRLHALRRELKRLHKDDCTVTELAHAHGFTQLGRVAGLYKTHFGETPSETLRRSV